MTIMCMIWSGQEMSSTDEDYFLLQTAIRYGVSDYILKPVNQETLNATLRKVRERYLEHETQVEEELEQQKQQATAQARLRELLWQDLEAEQLPEDLESFNEKAPVNIMASDLLGRIRSARSSS